MFALLTAPGLSSALGVAMDAVVRVRAVVAFGVAVVSAVAGTLIVTQAWGVEAAPGASESTVVMITPRRVLDTRDVIFFASVMGFALFTTGVIIRNQRAG